MVIVSTHDDRITHIADRVIELAPQFSTADAAPEEVRWPPGRRSSSRATGATWSTRCVEGSIEIFRAARDGTEEVAGLHRPGNYFGEIGPMLNLPRSASARAEVATLLTAMTSASFRHASRSTVKEARGPPGT